MSGFCISNLNLSLQGKSILQDLNLDFASGEFVVLAGPSGSGKSSLLRALAGLLPLDSGQILADGQGLSDMPPGQRDIAMVFQDHALMPHLNVAENLAFGLRARGMAKAQALSQAKDVAVRLGLESLLQRKPAAISGGEQQRVALGRAMLRQARLVLMDEPLSSLDAPLRARLRQEILQLHRAQGWTTVYVTHDQAEALSMADRLGILQDGRLLQFDEPAKVYRQPEHIDVARFVGNPIMNLLPMDSEERSTMKVQLGAGEPEIWLGVRAEDIELRSADYSAADRLCLQASLSASEYVGDHSVLGFDYQGHRIQLRRRGEIALDIGDRASLLIDTKRACLFDAHTGKAVN